MSAPCNDTSADPQTHPSHERRATQHALNVWTKAREDDELPDLAGLNRGPDMIEDREVLSENHFLIMIEAYSSNTMVIFYGSELPNMLARRNVGENFRKTLPSTLREIFQDACMEVADNGEEVHRQGVISTSSGDVVLYRSVFLPLRSAGHPERLYVFGAFSNEQGGAALLAAA